MRTGDSWQRLADYLRETPVTVQGYGLYILCKLAEDVEKAQSKLHRASCAFEDAMIR